MEKSAVSAATELRQMAALLEGLRALGSGRVLDEVLALVLDSAIEVTGAERGFIMLANRDGQLEFKLARARGKVTLSGRTFETSRKIPEAGVRDRPADDRRGPARRRSRAAPHRHRRARHPPRAVHAAAAGALRGARRAARRRRDHRRAVSRQPRARRAEIGVRALGARDAQRRGGARDRERAALPRGARQSQVRAGAQGRRRDSAVAAAGVEPRRARSSRRRPPRSPCRAVGGDFFDYVDLPTGQFGFILGDVAGKGSPAALLAAAVLGMFSAEATYQTAPRRCSRGSNRGLFRRAIEARFLTAFYGILGPDGSFTYCNAGHNAPMLVSARHGVRRLETGGVVLGLFEHASFEEETVTLQPGDFIVAFSDGVTEAFNAAGEEFTDDRLLASIERHRGKRPRRCSTACSPTSSVLRRGDAERRRDDRDGALRRPLNTYKMTAGSMRGI